MNGFPTRQQVERIKERYPSGTKIRMEHMADPYAPIPPPGFSPGRILWDHTY